MHTLLISRIFSIITPFSRCAAILRNTCDHLILIRKQKKNTNAQTLASVRESFFVFKVYSVGRTMNYKNGSILSAVLLIQM